MKIIRGLLPLLFLCLSTESVQAVHFEPLGTDRGLEAQVISALLVDQQGFLWVGSREGLYRYDGYRSIRFSPDAANADSISDADIRTMYEDSSGTLWIATNSGGLNHYDAASGKFKTYRHESARDDSLSNDSVYGMAECEKEKLWVGTQNGLNLLDTASGTSRRFFNDPEDPHSLSQDYVFAALCDHTGTAWITTIGGGVNRWNPDLERFDRFDFSARLQGDAGLNDVFTISETNDGILWFGTRHGLVRLDPEADELTQVPLVVEGDVELVITSTVVDGQGRIWMTALAAGVLIYDPENGETQIAQSRSMGAKGQLPAVPQLALALTGDLLFVGTWGSGVYSGRIREPDYRLLTSGPEKEGLRFRTVMAVLPGDTTGHPWVGTYGGGLQQVNVTAGAVLPDTDATRPLESLAVLSLLRMTDGRIFAATSEGLWEFSADLQESRVFLQDPGQAGALGGGQVTRLVEDSSGGLWVGLGGSGVYFLEPGSQSFLPFRHDPGRADSLADDFITALLQTEPGSIWVGTRSNGLNLCTLEPWSCEHFNADSSSNTGLGHFHVTDIFEDNSGEIWVTTDGGGLHRIVFSAEGNIEGFKRWTRQEGLISDATVAMVQDDDESLWISTREGISRFDPTFNRFENFVANAGLPVSHFNVGAASRDERFLYFGSVDGLLIIPAGTPFMLREPSPVSLTSVEQTSAGRTGLVSTIQSASQSVPYGEVLSVGFAVLDFAEVPHEYEYQLDKSDEWIGLGSKRDVTFFGLAPGNHELRARGRDVFGSWNQAAPFRISVIPPFWMTAWFRGLLIASLALLVLFGHQARTAALRRRNAALRVLQTEREQALESAQESQAKLKEAYNGLRDLTRRLESVKEEERQTISRELHDELGQLLTAAKLNLQMARKNSAEPPVISRLDDSVAMLDRMIQQVRDISLSLRPPLLDEAGLVAALEHYLDLIQQRSGIEIHLEVGPEVSGNSPPVSIVAFRVVQEAVNNALKHSGASRIEVSLHAENENLLILISDNGCGFDPSEIRQRVQRGEHLGLLGMGERIDAVGGTFEIDSTPGQGSRITVRIPR